MSAADSLYLTGFGNLVNPAGTPSVFPTDGTNVGAPNPEVVAVARLLLDGDIVTGRRSSNRQIVLPIVIDGNATDVVAARNRLVAAADQPGFTLTWVPPSASGLPTVMFDCFRASAPATEQTWWHDDGTMTKLVTLTIPALPFSRSPNQTTLAPSTINTTLHTFSTPTSTFTASSTTGTPVAPSLSWTFAPIATSANVLSAVDSDFESGTPTWTVTNGTGGRDSNANTQLSGSYAWKVTANSTSALSTQTASGSSGYAVTAGKPYAISSWVRAASTTRTVTITVKWFTSAGAASSHPSDTVGSTTDSNTAWKQIYGNVTAPADAAHAQIVVSWGATASSEGHWIDLVKLQVATADLTAAPYLTLPAQSNFAAVAVDWPWMLTLTDINGATAFLEVDDTFPGTTGYVTVVFPVSEFNLTYGTGTCDLTQITQMQLVAQPHTVSKNSTTWTLYLGSLNLTDSAVGSLTGESGTITYSGIAGTARTPISVAVAANGGLTMGRLLLSRSPSAPPGFNPVLGNAEGNGTRTGGDFSDATAITWTRGAQSLAGTYVVWARLGNLSTSHTLTVTASIDNNFSVTAARNGFRSDEIPAVGATYALVPIGELTLPPRDVPIANTAATITFTVTGTFSNLHDMYLVDMAGDFTLIDLSSIPTSFAHMWVDAPDQTSFYGRTYGGSAADRSNALSLAPWLHGSAVFNFDPGEQTLLVLADGATSGAMVTVTYYPRYFAEINA